MPETVCPGGLGRGYGNGAGLSGFDTILPTALETINHEKARLRLALAEKAINLPFNMRASLRLDHALLALEELEAGCGL